MLQAIKPNTVETHRTIKLSKFKNLIPSKNFILYYFYLDMNKVVGFLKFIFYISLLLLIIITLYPGSLLGLLLYGDLSMQPNLAENPYITPIPSHLYSFANIINHFIAYFLVSMLGLCLYLRSRNFQKIIFGLFFLSIFLEVLQFIILR